jgi:hypothetical protein
MEKNLEAEKTSAAAQVDEMTEWSERHLQVNTV